MPEAFLKEIDDGLKEIDDGLKEIGDGLKEIGFFKRARVYLSYIWIIRRASILGFALFLGVGVKNVIFFIKHDVFKGKSIFKVRSL